VLFVLKHERILLCPFPETAKTDDMEEGDYFEFETLPPELWLYILRYCAVLALPSSILFTVLSSTVIFTGWPVSQRALRSANTKSQVIVPTPQQMLTDEDVLWVSLVLLAIAFLTQRSGGSYRQKAPIISRALVGR